ncbi:MAG: hypothetical protein ACR2QL_13905 [Woeseiaceae bacterium]
MAGSYFSRVILIPSAVFLSALFGGAYGSGREVVEFISRHGPIGGFVAIISIALAYATCLFLVYELARMFKAWEYRGFAERLLGPAKILYEVLLMIGLLLGLAICASAGGAIASSYFGMPELAGGTGILLIIIALIYFGRKIVEESMVLSVSALGLILVYLLYVTLTRHGSAIGEAFAGAPLIYDGVGTGLKYALTNCGFLPLLLYSVVDLKSRKETAVTAGTAAIAGVIPAIAFHLAFMMAFPDIVDQQLPTYWLIESIMPAAFLAVYVFVVFVLVAQTGVALLQGVIESLDAFMQKRRGKPLSSAGHASVSGVAVILASVFASVGIVELIIRVYGFLSISFFVVFFIPLFTLGAYQVWRGSSA